MRVGWPPSRRHLVLVRPKELSGLKSFHVFARSLRFVPGVALVAAGEAVQEGEISHERFRKTASSEFLGAIGVTFSAKRFSRLDKNPVPLPRKLSSRAEHSSPFAHYLFNDFVTEFRKSSVLFEASRTRILRIATYHLINFRGNMLNLGGVIQARTATGVSFALFFPEGVFEKEIPLTFGFNDLTGSVLSAEWLAWGSFASDAVPMLRSIEINTVSSDWEKLRAAGVNIPKILFFDYLGNPVKLGALIDPSEIDLSDGLRPSYRFDYANAIFDLDGTLVDDRGPIIEIVDFLRFQRELGKNISLLTRNTGEVSKTLGKIGISPEVFQEIKVVQPEERKSTYAKVNSIFIDNEFQQRVDVATVEGVRSLDLDQVDFFEKDQSVRFPKWSHVTALSSEP